MAKKRLTLIIILLVVIFNNCATTTLIRTESKYVQVSPKKTRLKFDLNISADKISPIIEIKLSTEVLHQKVKTDFYKRDYSPGKCLGCLSINSIAIPLILVGAGTSILETLEFWIGALGANTLIVLGLDEVWKDKEIRKEQIIEQDTCYREEAPFANQSVEIRVAFSNEKMTGVTDENGWVKVDIREFYGSIAPGSDLELEISSAAQPTIIPTKAKIPASYVQNVKNYEHEAEKIFLMAQENETKKQYNQALADYNQIIAQYSESKVVGESKAKITTLQEKIKEEKIREIKKKLHRVSDYKVKDAILKLSLDEEERNALADAVKNLPSAAAVLVMKEGLEMPMSDNECIGEYSRLNLYQKFYVVVCYVTKYASQAEIHYYEEFEVLGDWPDEYYHEVTTKLSNKLNIPRNIIANLIGLEPNKLLRK